MALLERETHLAELHRALDAAQTGRGCTVLVSGEAGIGKTSLVDRFAQGVHTRARLLRGACEALFTPQPLGPVHDLVHALGGPVLAQLQSEAKPIDLFHGVLEAIRNLGTPSMIVLEDMHWADHATLDFVRFIARRITQVPVIMVLTYRDDEIGADHPLAAVLGELPPDGRIRLKLPALTRATVEQLASDAGRPVNDLFRVTGGNPFFVTELLRADTDAMAPSIREAVLARARHLTERARSLLDLVSVVPDRLQLVMLEQISGSNLDALEECIARGLLDCDADHVHFRHELARLAVEDALSPVKRVRLHRTMLDVLTSATQDGATLARIAHHAIAAKDVAAIIQFVPQAARIATTRRSHREAAALLSAALPYVDRLSTPEKAAFYEQRMQACIVMNQGAEARAMSEAAYRLWNKLGDDFAKGCNLVSRYEIGRAQDPIPRDDSLALAREAIALLERFPASSQLAVAYAALAMQIGVDDAIESTALRARALAIAESSGDADARARILGRCASAEWMAHGACTPTAARRLMDEARRARNDMEVMRAYQQSAVLHFQSRELDRLDECVRAASDFTRERELHDYLLTHSLERYGGEVMLARGDWQDAIGRFEAIARRETLPWWMRLVLCQLQIALIHARQGKAVDEGCLSESLNRQDELPINNLYVLHRTLAEIAWLRDDRDAGRSSAAIAIDIAIKWGHPWACGEASLWLRLASDDDPPFVADGARIFAEPYSRLFAGEARGASQMWKQRGYRYEEGVALMHGDETDQREAIHLFEALGAKAAAERVRERMRALGLRSIPLGPQASTKANAAGLSDRELEVLVLLADGLTNAEMATRLHRSVRTIENHVAAILAKLDAGSRLNAVTIARKRSLISK